jgi:hypothetical protein
MTKPVLPVISKSISQQCSLHLRLMIADAKDYLHSSIPVCKAASYRQLKSFQLVRGECQSMDWMYTCGRTSGLTVITSSLSSDNLWIEQRT